MNNYVENDVFNFGNTDVDFDYSVENQESQNVEWNLNSNNNESDNIESTKNDSFTQDGSFSNQNASISNDLDNIADNDYVGNLIPTEINSFETSNSVDVINDTKNDLMESQNEFESFDGEYGDDGFKIKDIFGMDYIQSNEQPVVESTVEKEEEPLLVEPFVQDENEHSIEATTDEVVEETSLTETFVQSENEPSAVEEVVEDNQQRNIQMSDTDLSSLTSFKEEALETTDIKSLFNRVGINVKEASDIFKKNTEMKEKLDSRFEELKKLQLEVSKRKQEQYDEINSYKEEVLSKLTEKKDEIERRLNKLKDFQTSLEKEKEEFEKYRKQQNEEIERVQKEVQDAYDSRREELKKVEDVLRTQKDSLDEERNQLSLDKIQYESDKNELANNLLKFNEIVDSFTKGIEKIDKE